MKRVPPSVPWTIEPGVCISRDELHRIHGGRQQSAISPSSTSSNIMLFTSNSRPVSGHPEGMQGDGCFYYTGEGTTGDQEMRQGNKALLEHEEEGRSVRLFHGSSGMVIYHGKFKLDKENPFYLVDALDADNEMRTVYVFRLRPLDVSNEAPMIAKNLAPSVTVIEDMGIDEKQVERFTRAGTNPGEAERRKKELVAEYLEYRYRQRKNELVSLRIRQQGETQPLYTDMYDNVENRIIEAKGGTPKEHR